MKSITTNNIEWIFAVFFVFFTNPYFIWGTPVSLICAIFLYAYIIMHMKQIPKKYIVPGSLFSIFYFIVALRYGLSFALIYTAAIPLLLFINERILLNSYNKFIKLLCILLVPSIMVYVLIVFLKLNIEYDIISPLNDIKGQAGIVYYRYPFLIVDPTDKGDILPRFFGLFDEPGVIGTLCALILTTRQYNIKDKYNITLFIAGIFTFSLYFYIITIIFYLVSVKRDNIIKIVIGAIVVVVLLLKIKGFDELILNRFVIENGVWKGNSRNSFGFATWYDNFRFTFDYFIGLGPGASSKYNAGGASYKDIVVNYGVICFIIYVASLVLYVWKSKSFTKDRMLALVVIMGYIFQRPFITDIFLSISFLYIFYNSTAIKNELSVVK